MNATERGDHAASTADDDHEAYLERSRQKWDRWSRIYGINERDTEPIRREMIDLLELEPGDAVVEVGCGPGVNFELLREAVGSEGRVLGIDYSPEMLARARERIDEHGWENVEVRREDATRADLDPESFDAAVAAQALSAMPDVRAVVDLVHDALRPGGRLGVYGVRLVPSGRATVLNPFILRFYRWFANWNDEEEVLAELERAFEDVDVVSTYALGTNYVAAATKGRGRDGETDG